LPSRRTRITRLHRRYIHESVRELKRLSHLAHTKQVSNDMHHENRGRGRVVGNADPWIFSASIWPFCTGVVAFSGSNVAKARLERMIFKAKYYCLVKISRLDALAR
jgi:hypothetical protein